MSPPGSCATIVIGNKGDQHLILVWGSFPNSTAESVFLPVTPKPSLNEADILVIAVIAERQRVALHTRTGLLQLLAMTLRFIYKGRNTKTLAGVFLLLTALVAAVSCQPALSPGAMTASSTTKDGATSPTGDPMWGSGSASSSGSSRTLLTSASFEDCDPSFPTFADHANNYTSNTAKGGVAHSGSCSTGIGLNGATYGKLTTKPFAPSTDLWLSGWVYFAPQFALPQTNVPYNGQNCSMGVHFWRLSDAVPAKKVSMDLNIPTALSTIQLLFFQLDGNGSVTHQFVKWTSFHPASDSLRGTWQYWEVHINLGTPGNTDGFLRFYTDDHLVDSLENQPFLPISADSTWAISRADFQSNISDGGNPICDGAWPSQNGWFVDDVQISH